MTMQSFRYGFRWGEWACAPAGGRGAAWHRAQTRPPEHAAPAYWSWSLGPTFGVRRPLRYLAFKLDLTEDQVRELADVLNRLKTARAQSQLDWERSVADAADAFAPAGFDEVKARDALAQRVRSNEVLNDEVLAALKRVHALLHEDQRREFAYLLRSGSLTI